MDGLAFQFGSSIFFWSLACLNYHSAYLSHLLVHGHCDAYARYRRGARAGGGDRLRNPYLPNQMTTTALPLPPSLLLIGRPDTIRLYSHSAQQQVSRSRFLRRLWSDLPRALLYINNELGAT